MKGSEIFLIYCKKKKVSAPLAIYIKKNEFSKCSKTSHMGLLKIYAMAHNDINYL